MVSGGKPIPGMVESIKLDLIGPFELCKKERRGYKCRMEGREKPIETNENRNRIQKGTQNGSQDTDESWPL